MLFRSVSQSREGGEREREREERERERERETVEQFSDLVVKARQGNKWFIERALNEEPTLIEEDRVETAAIQG